MSMNDLQANEQRVLLLAPTGKDGAITHRLLHEAGIECTVVGNLRAVCVELAQGAAAIILTEEALEPVALHELVLVIRQQPVWSDLPVILLTHDGTNSMTAMLVLETLANVLVIDRPIHIVTLISTVRTALRARNRQYQLREHLHAQERYAAEREQLYAAEQEARATAEAALQVRNQFLSVAAHELKTPLTTLLGTMQLIERRAHRDQTPSEREQRPLQVAIEQGRRLQRMIDGLLDISRIELGQLQIVAAPLDLCPFARRVVEELQPSLTMHSVVYEALDVPVMVMGDELRLEQVLQNLLQNAVRYSPDGGTIIVRVAHEPHYAIVSVQDSGVGIPPPARARLFERFYRVPNESAATIHGVGIGLYVVKEIVLLHDGTIDVVSEVGAGSIFTVRLPLLKEEYESAITFGRADPRA